MTYLWIALGGALGSVGRYWLNGIISERFATFPAGTDGHGRITASDFVTDTFLTQVLATATGRIGVKLNAEPTLAMPVDPVIGQIIERCAAPRE